MATLVGLHHRIYLGHLDLSGLANEVSFGPLTAAMQDCTTFNDAGYTCVKPGLKSGAAAVRGFQDFAAGVLDAEISVPGQLGTQYPFTVVPATSTTVTAGDVCWLARGVLAQHSPFGGQVGEMAKFDLGNLAYDTAIARGQVAHPKTARTSTGTGTALTLTGPTASQKLYAALHVTAYSGFTNVVFKVQSDDNSGFTSATDRITFTTVTGTTSQWSSVAGDFSSETHHRVTWTVTGSGSVTFFAAVGVI